MHGGRDPETVHIPERQQSSRDAAAFDFGHGLPNLREIVAQRIDRGMPTGSAGDGRANASANQPQQFQRRGRRRYSLQEIRIVREDALRSRQQTASRDRGDGRPMSAR
jgi:hypothetical protein